ncbi:hypothetical protein RUM44_009813 [Polyplax serrata]|uniref:Membrane insertase YidC/Oxa/ALB C-terminal domain-containing protein n=1 Tax=Polyplax serrata TaxID=468196 RepID=A0ABR1AUB0_POLSC
MAGLQTCLRKAFVVKSISTINGNYRIQQFVRKRHVLTFAVIKTNKSPRSIKSNASINVKNLLRWSSTSTIVSDGALDSSSLRAASSKDIIPQVGDAVSTQTPSQIAKGSDVPVNSIIDESLLPPIPVPPVEQISGDVADLGELASLGLGSWWPTGLIQRYLDFLHTNFDIPWWGSVAIVTLSVRLLIVPLYVKSRIGAVNMQNNMPELQVLQMKVSEARQTGNYYDAAHYVAELQNFMKEKNIGAFSTLLPMFAQTPIFLSMFWGLRGMTSAPVESMKTGGLLWFPDLTMADPYYILPLSISSTLFIIIETGAEGGTIQNAQQIWVKHAMRFLPVIVFPMTMNFCSALQFYWLVSNLISLVQVLILKIPAVRQIANIPPTIKHDPEKLPMNQKNKKGALADFKESLQNAKLIRELQDRERLNTVTFEKAGTGPIPRTFKKDPTKMKVAVK